MDYIEIGKDNKLFEITENKIIYYGLKNKLHYEKKLGKEELVRAYTLAELVINYGYEIKNIDFEVSAQQGSGDTFADIVIYYPDNKAFIVIELKEENTKDKRNKILKQARSYATSLDINADYYAFRVGFNEFEVFKTKDDKSIEKIPYDYSKTLVYAYLDEEKEKTKNKLHYKNLEKSTPYELKQVFSRCHDEIWNGGEKNAQDAFDEFSKLLFLKMYDELGNEGNHEEPYFFQVSEFQSEENLKDLIEKKYNQAIIDKKVNSDKTLLTPLNLNKHQMHFVIKELQKYSLTETDNDPKGLAFETFVEHYMKGEFGQFFTPRNIVDFMLKVSPIHWDKNFNNESKILDPCCGSGSFLVHSVTNFRQRFKKQSYWQYFANNSVFGIELNDKISVTAKINFALHDDGHDNVQCSNGLNADYKFKDLKSNIDLILTNPPFGTQIKSKNYEEKEIKKYYENDKDLKEFLNYKEFDLTQKFFDKVDILREKIKKLNDYQNSISSEILFFELYYRMLKDGGIAEVVIPDGILTNSSLQHFRDYLSEHFQILAIISLPQFTFSHYGAGVKSSIIIIKKYPIAKTKEIQKAKEKYLKIALNENLDKLKELENEKKGLDKKYLELKGIEKLTKEIKDTQEFKEFKREEGNILNEKIKDLKDEIYFKANEDFKKYEYEFNYPIFMAIAEYIGYDATGRETSKNDLDTIAIELKEFLQGNIKDSL